MAALDISQELATDIAREAQNQGLSIEDFLNTAVRRQRTLTARQKIESEQQWWLDQPLRTRLDYEGQFVAVHNRQVIDHDADKIVLTKRVRASHPDESILIIPAEGPQEVRIYSPRLT